MAARRSARRARAATVSCVTNPTGRTMSSSNVAAAGEQQPVLPQVTQQFGNDRQQKGSSQRAVETIQATEHDRQLQRDKQREAEIVGPHEQHVVRIQAASQPAERSTDGKHRELRGHKRDAELRHDELIVSDGRLESPETAAIQYPEADDRCGQQAGDQRQCRVGWYSDEPERATHGIDVVENNAQRFSEAQAEDCVGEPREPNPRGERIDDERANRRQGGAGCECSGKRHAMVASENGAGVGADRHVARDADVELLHRQRQVVPQGRDSHDALQNEKGLERRAAHLTPAARPCAPATPAAAPSESRS